MSNFILRGIDPEFWARVQTKAKAEGIPIKALIVRLLTAWLGVVLLLTVTACGGDSSPVSPTPTPTPTPAPIATTFILAGTVASTTGPVIQGATVRIADGPNVGRSTVTNSNGSYSFATLTASSFTLNVSAPFYVAKGQSVTVTSNQTANVELVPVPLFTRSGNGNTVFDMPTSIPRVRVVADYSGRCQNFIMHIGGRSIANEILGTCSVATTGAHYEAIALTTGGVVEIVNSSGIAWSLTEVR